MSDSVFRYTGFELDREANQLQCHWEVGGHRFTEQFVFPETSHWDAVGVDEAVRWVYLLSGISYYKTLAPATIDLGGLPVTQDEVGFLYRYYKNGLGEFAYRADEKDPSLNVMGVLDRLEFTNYAPTPNPPVAEATEQAVNPLVPFGGGVDSLVSVELLRAAGISPTLFVVSRNGEHFAGVDEPVAATGLPVVRIARYLDESVLRSAELGFYNGHVPVTGIISALGLLAAVLHGHDAVVMSNEWSANSATISKDGVEVNHQYSKSAAFEADLSQFAGSKVGVDYFSLLRPRSELWIAREFAARCGGYLDTFCSCNKAFILDPARRSDGWCGKCEKCCFVNLILSPYLSRDALAWVFHRTGEPLENPALKPEFDSLVSAAGREKPWECVGDVDESRVAIALAAERADRAGNQLLAVLSAEAPASLDANELMVPHTSNIPSRYLQAAQLS